MKTTKESNPFGQIHFKLFKTLHQQKRYAQALFSLYIACRSNIETWEYTATDIISNTEISRKTVYAFCEMFVREGIFKPAGTTGKGSHKYALNKPTFDAYMKGNNPLSSEGEEKGSPACYNCSLDKIPSVLALPASENEKPSIGGGFDESGVSQLPTRTCVTTTHQMISGDTSMCVTATHLGASWLPTNNKEENEEEKKDDTKDRCVVSSFKNLPNLASEKARTFINLVKLLQARESEAQIVIHNSSEKTAMALFESDPNLMADDLFVLFNEAVMERYYIRDWANVIKNTEDRERYISSIPKDGEYDPLFYLMRSNDVSFFMKYKDKINIELNNYFAEFGGFRDTKENFIESERSYYPPDKRILW